jgi:hypothetical protein
MDAAFYFEQLYPLQDQVLARLRGVETGFYLTGGTVTSRIHLRHRFSDNLDFFVNDDDHFPLWVDRFIHALQIETNWQVQVSLRDIRFARLFLTVGEVVLKVEMVNDVPARVGEVQNHPIFGKIDTPENILANKVTAALDRNAPKDIADIWGLCTQLGLSLTDAIEGAQGKAIGVFPADLARVLCTAQRTDWELVRWITPPDSNQYLADLRILGEHLLLLD